MENKKKRAGIKLDKKRYGNLILIFAVLLSLLVFCSLVNDKFFTMRNMRNLFQGSFPLLMVAMGQGMVILTGGIDLSLGAMVALSNVICVTLMKPDEPLGFLLAVVVSLLTGAVGGLANGLIITRGGIFPIIATLTTTTIYEGFALMIMSEPGGEMHKAFARFITGKMDVPFGLFLFLVLLLLMRYLTNDTPFGKAMRAIGGNELAAYSTGVKIEKIKAITYTLSGVLAAVAGIYLSGIMFSGDSRIGKQYSMNAVTASVIGGIYLTGSVGDLFGAMAGVFIITIINNILNLTGISSYYQYVFQGLILITVLAIPAVKDMVVLSAQKRGAYNE